MPLIYNSATDRPVRHHCDLPNLDNLGFGSIARCNSCGRLHYYGAGVDRVGWLPSWPWHRAWWWATGRTR